MLLQSVFVDDVLDQVSYFNQSVMMHPLYTCKFLHESEYLRILIKMTCRFKQTLSLNSLHSFLFAPATLARFDMLNPDSYLVSRVNL